MKAFIFDMDGVIINTEPIINGLVKELCIKLGICLSEEELFKLTGVSSKNFWTYMQQNHNLNQNLDEYKKMWDINREIAAYKKVSIDTNLLIFLRLLQKSNIKIAMATSAGELRMNLVLDIFSLRKYFNVTVCDMEISKSKPDPEIFLLAARKLQIEPQNCVVIEDTDYGIEAAINAGMTCWLYTKYTKAGKLSHNANFIFSDFAELYSKI
ncbi:MAG: HAD family phosphatase [Chloroflexi bacterium]|nr:HAD family phosphatase [Chloroflexota bacterium]